MTQAQRRLGFFLFPSDVYNKTKKLAGTFHLVFWAGPTQRMNKDLWKEEKWKQEG